MARDVGMPTAQDYKRQKQRNDELKNAIAGYFHEIHKMRNAFPWASLMKGNKR